DRFTLYEWIDHMLSVSNNGAASVVWREALLMRVFGQDYLTLTQEEADDYFRSADRRELSDLANSVVNEPLRHLGIGEEEWRLGTMFTRGGSDIVPPQGGSIGSPAGLMKWLVALEGGRVIDPASSLEIKRLMYMTDRRIRYAHSPALDSAAVFFKSGSLYSCGGGPCRKYHGTRMNFMNSVAIVEQPRGGRYLVALMSNVLGRNSAYDHQLLASRIDNLIQQTPASEANLDEVRNGGE
ncbi:MAG: serine hydrolase, partial [Bacteroidota bacterium]